MKREEEEARGSNGPSSSFSSFFFLLFPHTRLLLSAGVHALNTPNCLAYVILIIKGTLGLHHFPKGIAILKHDENDEAGKGNGGLEIREQEYTRVTQFEWHPDPDAYPDIARAMYKMTNTEVPEDAHDDQWH